MDLVALSQETVRLSKTLLEKLQAQADGPARKTSGMVRIKIDPRAELPDDILQIRSKV